MFVWICKCLLNEMSLTTIISDSPANSKLSLGPQIACKGNFDVKCPNCQLHLENYFNCDSCSTVICINCYKLAAVELQCLKLLNRTLKLYCHRCIGMFEHLKLENAINELQTVLQSRHAKPQVTAVDKINNAPHLIATDSNLKNGIIEISLGSNIQHIVPSKAIISEKENIELIECSTKVNVQEPIEQMIENKVQNKPQYSCKICSKTFKNKTMFTRHTKRHNKLECELCKKTFLQASALKRHVRIHKITKHYTCEECNSTYREFDQYQSHKLEHDQVELNKCKLQNNISSDKIIVELHMKSCQGVISHQECGICHKSFENMNHYKKHMLEHKTKKPYKCDICHKTTALLSNHKSHMKIHAGVRSFLCDICSKAFNRMNDLKIHLRTHTGEKPYECTVCKKKFSQLNQHKLHLRTHTGEKPFECATCKKRFSRSSSYKIHMRTHTGEKPYKCDVCHKLSRQLGDHKIHMRTHTGERPYTCDVCSRSFSHLSQHKSHMRTHTGEKPYSCKVCGKSFSRIDTHRVHMRTHTGEKPYECRVCGKCFSDTSHMRRHSRTHADGR